MNKLVEVKKTSCTFCTSLCGVQVHVEDGRIAGIEGNQAHPLSRGFVCERVRLAQKWLYQPRQLRYPLRRIGKRGEGRWERVGWDEAMADIGQRLSGFSKQNGAETVAVFGGEDKGNNYWPRGRFLTLLGNPYNTFGHGVMCGVGDMAINRAVMGDDASHGSQVAGSNCAVYWGANPAESRQRDWAALMRQRQKREMNVIAIDPRQTRTTEVADMWLRPRPGTDTALAMGWLNIIISEGLYDKSFVEEWTVGFDQLRSRVQEYPPQRCADITGIPVEQIVESARMYATSKPACIVYGVAADHFGRNSTRTEHARVILRAITGNLGVPGGEMVMRPGIPVNGGQFVTEADLTMIDRLTEEQRSKQMGISHSRLVSLEGWSATAEHIERVYGTRAAISFQCQAFTPLLWRAILNEDPYPIKALITWGSNTLSSTGNAGLVYDALKSENLKLHVVHDLVMTPTAQLADYVMPAASWLERDLCTNYGDIGSVIVGGEKAIQPLGERRDVYEFFRGLGIAVGQVEFWPWENQEEVIDYRLKPAGLGFRDLVERMVLLPDRMDMQPWKQTGFPTPSGKVELYSSILEGLGHDPMPFYEEPPESPVSTPEVVAKYPLILNTGGRFMPMYHSGFMEKDLGRVKHPDPLVDIHPETARNHGIDNGDWVYIETKRGRIRQRVRLNPGILPNVVNCQAGWLFPEMPPEEPYLSGIWESNANVLTLDEPDACDQLSGGWCVRALLCRVYKA